VTKIHAALITGFNPTCWRRLNFDHLCRFKIDQGLLLV